MSRIQQSQKANFKNDRIWSFLVRTELALLHHSYKGHSRRLTIAVATATNQLERVCRFSSLICSFRDGAMRQSQTALAARSRRPAKASVVLREGGGCTAAPALITSP